MAVTYTSDYRFIELALLDRQKSFIALEKEMETFKPLPAADFEVHRVRMREHLRRLNPSHSDEEIEKFVKSQVDFESSEQVQFSEAFSNRIMIEQVAITMLSHALCEAVINAILALGLVHNKSEQLFKVVERADVKEKWTIGPLCFEPSYKLLKSSHLYEALYFMCKRRNAFFHYKIKMHVDEKEILVGCNLDRLSFKETTKWMNQFFRLPYELHAHACNQIRDPFLQSQIRSLLYNPFPR